MSPNIDPREKNTPTTTERSDTTPEKGRAHADEDSDAHSCGEEECDEVYDTESFGSGHSWESNEYAPLELNHDALHHIATYYLPGDHGKCTNIRTLERGSYHEIRVLEFEDGWSCIGRFTRNRKELLSVTESEVATVKYVRQHTRIPVPDTYFVNFDPTNAVGAAFVLMEKMPGIHLYAIWDALRLEQKLGVMDQVVDILVQLASLKFENIGSINIHGKVGPVQNLALPPSDTSGRLLSSTQDYLFSFISKDSQSADEVKTFYPEIKKRIQNFLHEQTDDPIYNAPFRLIHGDFDGQNLLLTWPNRSEIPTLSGVIDWDHSYTGPLYYLYEYPEFIRDSDISPETEAMYPENKTLRQHLVRTLAQRFPKGSVDREDVRECFRQKSYIMNVFRDEFMMREWRDAEHELNCVTRYAEGVSGQSDERLLPYNRRWDYEADSELSSDDELA